MAAKRPWWIAGIIATCCLVICAVLWRALNQPDPEFRFLADLKPMMLHFAKDTSVNDFDVLNPFWEEPRNSIGRVYVFPSSRADAIEKLLSAKFGAHPSTSLSSSVMASGSMGFTMSSNSSASFWEVGKGRYIAEFSGDMADIYGKRVTDESIPANSCLVVTLNPPSWIERQIEAVARFLHMGH
jgi:hypothetical protein